MDKLTYKQSSPRQDDSWTVICRGRLLGRIFQLSWNQFQYRPRGHYLDKQFDGPILDSLDAVKASLEGE